MRRAFVVLIAEMRGFRESFENAGVFSREQLLRVAEERVVPEGSRQATAF
jgi:hypothetical protein